MKSYFAKLAARATIANIPVAPSRFPGSPDPFEAVAPEFGSSPPTIPQPSGVRDDAREQSAGKPVLKTEYPISGDVVRVDPAQSHERETRSQPPPRFEQPAETLSTAFEIPPPRTALSQARDQTQDPKLQREREPMQPARSENRSTTPIAPKLSLDSTEVLREPASDEQLEEIQREQSMLLRKADAFMSALLERRSETANPSIERQADLEIPPSKAEPSRAQIPTRLQPPAPAVRAHDDSDDRPSLVIGKLTVEVMPPPAPPVAPSRQVVIVREGGSVRGAARNSIQRFGLGQF